jgi:putative hydrolase of the HAD superfamily
MIRNLENLMSTKRRDESPDVRALILDYGEVLCYRPPSEEFRRMANVFGLSLDSFRARWEASRILIDCGDLTPEAYWLKFAEEAGIKLESEQVEKLCRWEIEMWSTANPTMVEWLLNVSAAGIKTGLLSNMPADLAGYVQDNFDWMNKFTFKTFSAHVKLVKPDPAIYEHTLRGLGVKASETLFVDDRENNIQAARALGMHAIRFQSVEQLRNDLEGLGFPILPVGARMTFRDLVKGLH